MDEARLFGGKLRLETSIETQVGRPGLVVRDTVTNLSAAASDFELLYHINFGPPLLKPGAKVLLPVKRLAPRDAVAVADLPTWNLYGPETPGSAEVCFFIEPAADADGNTQVLLHNAAATQGVSLKFNTRQLPCFTIWKNREAAADGYVTGLEPATNYPNIKSFEKRMGRVVQLEPGQSRNFGVALEPLPARPGCNRPRRPSRDCSKASPPRSCSQPDPRWSPSK